jgi:hypothetical protein
MDRAQVAASGHTSRHTGEIAELNDAAAMAAIN